MKTPPFIKMLVRRFRDCHFVYDDGADSTWIFVPFSTSGAADYEPLTSGSRGEQSHSLQEAFNLSSGFLKKKCSSGVRKISSLKWRTQRLPRDILAEYKPKKMGTMAGQGDTFFERTLRCLMSVTTRVWSINHREVCRSVNCRFFIAILCAGSREGEQVESSHETLQYTVADGILSSPPGTSLFKV